jgi:hypothetical protein
MGELQRSMPVPRRLLGVASVLSLSSAVLLLVVFAWGGAGDFEFLWGRGGALWEVIIFRREVVIRRISEWPRDEPLRRVHMLSVVIGMSAQDVTGRDFWFGAYTRASRVGVSGPGRGESLRSWDLTKADSPRTATDVVVYPERCALFTLILPAIWLFRRLIQRGRCGRGFEVIMPDGAGPPK